MVGAVTPPVPGAGCCQNHPFAACRPRRGWSLSGKAVNGWMWVWQPACMDAILPGEARAPVTVATLGPVPPSLAMSSRGGEEQPWGSWVLITPRLTNAHPCNPLRAGSPRPAAGAAGKAELSPVPSWETPSPLHQLLGKRVMKTSEQRPATSSEVLRSPRQSSLPRSPPRQNKKCQKYADFPLLPPPSPPPALQSQRLGAMHVSRPLISELPPVPFPPWPPLGARQKQGSGNASRGAQPAPGRAQPLLRRLASQPGFFCML